MFAHQIVHIQTACMGSLTLVVTVTSNGSAHLDTALLLTSLAMWLVPKNRATVPTLMAASVRTPLVVSQATALPTCVYQDVTCQATTTATAPRMRSVCQDSVLQTTLARAHAHLMVPIPSPLAVIAKTQETA